MSDSKVYSERLGAIRGEQFTAAFERLGLGRFVKAEPTTSGLFGQNVFVTTTSGEFVLRGAPHWVKSIDEAEFHRDDRLQFTSEAYFARQLHEHTKAPVPWPFLHVESDDIFGWPFLVMPRMPGRCFQDREIVKALEPADRRDVARALGANLAEMQRLTSPFAGSFSPVTIALEPYPSGYVDWAIRESASITRGAADRITEDDHAWIAQVAERAVVAGEPARYSYLHIDYKLNNLAVGKVDDDWRVTGLFDLHEARYGDGAHDLARQTCSYLDTDRDRAPEFLSAYLESVPHDASRNERLPLYIVNDRLKFWGFFTRPEHRLPYFDGKTFRGWAERYVDEIARLM
jgi:aminoglycoside phosphotransferase (APT) family kinase protein